MAKSGRKLSLLPSRDIPLNKLLLSDRNVRQTKANDSIEELAKDIQVRGLLQSLHVRPMLDRNEQETGSFEVLGGGRRLRALTLLVTQKRLAADHPIPCVVRPAHADTLPEEDSLAENAHRLPLHPLDQFKAFKTLIDQGLQHDKIAERFCVPVTVVEQRLRLANVSDTLLNAYADDEMTLEQLMAFTVTSDHTRQQQVWEALQHSDNTSPYHIRRKLTEDTVPASDKRARFVSVEVYEQEGGRVERDLFEEDGGGWLVDVTLLNALVEKKLHAEANVMAAEGWKWIAAAIAFPYGHARNLRRLQGTPSKLTADEAAAIEALQMEQAALEAQYESVHNTPEDVCARLDEIEARLGAFESRPLNYDPAEIRRAGAFVTIDADGELSIDRGYVKPEDEPPAAESPETRANLPDSDATEAGPSTTPTARQSIVTMSGHAQAEDDDHDGVRGLPDRLVGELTAFRTLALRNALAMNPDVAMTALLYKLCCDLLDQRPTDTCLQASVQPVHFTIQPADLRDSPPAHTEAARHQIWKEKMPEDESALWDWLVSLDPPSRAMLFAHCVSFGVNALFEKVDRYQGASDHGLQSRLVQANRIARAVGLDIVQVGWQATVENYLGRVPKALILEAVTEAKGREIAALMQGLKKSDMAKEAQRLLEGTAWLPMPLRLPAEQQAPGPGDETLPAFLENQGEGALRPPDRQG
jgi:ParB family transcriptional regulator, chromosome partitioning protein